MKTLRDAILLLFLLLLVASVRIEPSAERAAAEPAPEPVVQLAPDEVEVKAAIDDARRAVRDLRDRT